MHLRKRRLSTLSLQTLIFDLPKNLNSICFRSNNFVSLDPLTFDQLPFDQLSFIRSIPVPEICDYF
jgi:hypothetical protein